MKKTIFFALIIAIAIVSTFSSCLDSDKDLYDPSFQMPNPMGEGFTAPEGFDWSFFTDVQATVDVNDEYDGKYYYTVELYDANPIISENARLLYKDVAKKGQPYSSKIALDKTISTIYLKEITPTGLFTVRAADVLNGEIKCNFKSVTSTSRSMASTRGFVTAEEPGAIYFPTVSPTTEILINIWGSEVSAGKSFNLTKKSPADLNLGGKSNLKLYVTEDITLSNLYLAPDCHLYILPGKTVTIAGASTNNGQTGSLISVGKDATFKVNGELKLDNSFKLYSLGTINATHLTCTGNSSFYNAGTTNVAEKISGENSQCTLLNTGTIHAKNIKIQGGSHFVNREKVFVQEETELNCTDGSWENDGEWTTDDMTITGWNNFSYNRCKLIVENELNMHEAFMTLDAGAFVSCESLYMNNSKVDLGAKSLFIVAEEAEYGYQTNDKGFRGTGSEKALIKIKKAEAEDDKNGNIIHYSGALQILCSDHPEAITNKGEIRWTMTNGAEWAVEGKNTITIPKTACNDGSEGGTPGTPTDPMFPIIVEDNHNYSYIFEDQWPLYGDYDMNDIVLTVKKKKLSINSKVTTLDFSIELSAVGATKLTGAAIMLDGVKATDISSPVLFENNTPSGFNLNGNNIEKDQEFAVIPLFTDAHVAIGVDQNRRDFVNTLSGGASNRKGKTINFTVNFNKAMPAEAFNINKFNIFIIVGQNGVQRREVHVAGYQPTRFADISIFGGNDDRSSVANKKYYYSRDNLAWGVIVPTNFKWPLEYVNMSLAYKGFVEWVTSGGINNDKWYTKFETSNVFQTNKN